MHKAFALGVCIAASVLAGGQTQVRTVTGGTANVVPAWVNGNTIENTSSTQPGVVGGNLTVNGTTTMTGSATMNGSTTMNAGATINGSTAANGSTTLNGNTQIKGQNPWVDISTFGGLDDALTNTAMTSGGTVTVSNATGKPLFDSSKDTGKVIALAGGGFDLTQLYMGNIQSICNSSGQLTPSTHYFVQVTFEDETASPGSTFLTEGPPSAEVDVLTQAPGVCTGDKIAINVPAPTSPPSAVVGYTVYASLVSGGERQQILSPSGFPTNPAFCNSAALAASYNACPKATGTHLNKIFPEGPPPPRVATGQSAWQTTITGPFTNCSLNLCTTATLATNVLHDVTSVNVVWGMDNSAAFTNAMGSCVNSSTTNSRDATTVGCRIRFSVPTGTGHTGRYFMRTTSKVADASGNPLNNIVLGGDGGLGDTGLTTGGSFNLVHATPEIIVGSRVWGLQVGNLAQFTDTSSNVQGFEIESLGFEDAIGQAFGGVAMLGEVEGAFLDRVSLTNFANGSCLYMDGGASGSEVQIATIHKIRGNNCRWGILSPGAISDIEIDGGTVSSSLIPGTGDTGTGIGIDLETNPLAMTPPPNSALLASANVRIHDIAIRDFPTAHIKLLDVQAASVVQIKEEQVATNSLMHGIGIDLESQTGVAKCTNTRIAFPVIFSFATGITVGANCANADIYKPVITGLPTGATAIVDNGTNTSQVTFENGTTLGTSQSVNILVPNATVTGTTLNQLAQLTTTNCPSGVLVCAVNGTAGQTSGLIGPAIAGAGLSTSTAVTNATIAVAGVALCKFDTNGSTAGHFAAPAPAVGGRCADMATQPMTESIGVILDTNGNSASSRVALAIQRQ